MMEMRMASLMGLGVVDLTRGCSAARRGEPWIILIVVVMVVVVVMCVVVGKE